MTREEREELLDEEEVEDSEFNFQEGARRFGRWVGRSLPIIFAILISIFFIFYGTVKILPTEMSLKEQTIMVIITIVAGWSITTLIGEGGFTTAKNTRKFRDEVDRYNASVHSALKYRPAVDQLAKKRAKENLKNMRIRFCEAVNLWYWDIFNEEGYLRKDFDITIYKKDKKYHRKKTYYKKAVNLHIRNTNVFSRADSSTFGIRKEANETTYRTKNGITKFIIKIVFSIATVGIMFEFIGWSLGAVIYAFAQVVLWCSMGVIERIKNYNFILDKIRPQIEDKRVLIEEFLELSEEDKQYYINMAKEEETKHSRKMITYKGDDLTKSE